MSEDEKRMLQEKIEGWLAQQGYVIQRNQNPNLYSQLTVTDRAGRHYVLGIARGESDLVSMNFLFTPDGIPQQLGGIPIEERRKLYFDITSMLLQMHIVFESDISEEGIFSRFVFSKELFPDGLTKQALFDALQYLVEAFILTQMILAQKFGRNPQSGASRIQPGLG